jgi:hypothetical protein
MIFPAPVHFAIFIAAIYAVADLYAAMSRMRNRWTVVHVLAFLSMAVLTSVAYILGLVPLISH